MATSRSSRIGDFEPLTKLGEGGMGAVYKARQISLDRVVALKILPRRFASDKKCVERFLREARATAKLNHPNIVAGIDVGSDGGYHYFAMELVEGPTLRKRIDEEMRLPEDEVLRIGAAVASGLAHAHAMGIVHRDIKPENILLDAHGAPKIADLGLSKSEEGASLTTTGIVVGTGHYMAPEQARGEEVDRRCDTYSLGCTLFHAATGKTPFEGTSTAVVMVKHINEKLPHPRSLNPDLSDTFCLILSRMIARDREDRYQSLQEAADDLEALREGKPVKCKPLPPDRINFLSSAGKTGGKKELKPVAVDLEADDDGSSTRVSFAAAPRTQAPRAGSGAPEAPDESAMDRGSRKRVPTAKPRTQWVWQAGIGASVVLLILGVWLALSDSKPRISSSPTETAVTPAAPDPVVIKPERERRPEPAKMADRPTPPVNPGPPANPGPKAAVAVAPPPAPAQPVAAPAPAPDPNAKPLTEADCMKRFAWSFSVKGSAAFSCGWTAPDAVETLSFSPDSGVVLARTVRDEHTLKEANIELARLSPAENAGSVQLNVDGSKLSMHAANGKELTSDRLTENKTVRRDFFISAEPNGSIEVRDIKIEYKTK